jgi:methionyl-tRNA formyltransferase
MIFVGAGALLSHAIEYAKRARLAVDVICCPQRDPSILRFRKDEFLILETNDPNSDLPLYLNRCSDGVAFSINNTRILDDNLLGTGVSFFNVHNGLVQQYRGIAAVCIFAALCKGERRYGVTLHRMLPCQEVDSGPVIAQLAFDIGEHDGFADVLARSLGACREIFELNVGIVLSNSYTEIEVERSENIYSYKDVSKLCLNADAARLAKATNLGPYASFFPRLKSAIESAR